MKIRIAHTLFFAMILFSLAANAVTASPSSGNMTADLNKVKKLKEKGQYLAAQKLVEKLLDSPGLPEAKTAELKEEYSDIKQRILILKIQNMQKQSYTVKRGDTLYDIAKKYKTTVEFIKKSNNLKSDVIYPGMKLKMITGKFRIKVDKSDNILLLYLDSKLIKKYAVATGTKEKPTPKGEFIIINKLENPTWFHAGAVVPPDSPENILGTRWLGFDHSGYGIHGTTLPETIGQHASSGCVRMLNEDVEELYAVIPMKTKVIITN